MSSVELRFHECNLFLTRTRIRFSVMANEVYRTSSFRNLSPQSIMEATEATENIRPEVICITPDNSVGLIKEAKIMLNGKPR